MCKHEVHKSNTKNKHNIPLCNETLPRKLVTFICYYRYPVMVNVAVYCFKITNFCLFFFCVCLFFERYGFDNYISLWRFCEIANVCVINGL